MSDKSDKLKAEETNIDKATNWKISWFWVAGWLYTWPFLLEPFPTSYPAGTDGWLIIGDIIEILFISVTSMGFWPLFLGHIHMYNFF